MFQRRVRGMGMHSTTIIEALTINGRSRRSTLLQER